MSYVDQLARLLVHIVCKETMVVKNFIPRENSFGSEVASLKITIFFPFLTQNGPKFWPLKAKYGIP